MATPEKKPAPKKTYHRPNYPLTEQVIKEVMIQRNCSREKAIEILKNPTK